MLATEDLLNQMKISRPDHLPVVAAFCRRINLINIIDRIVPNEMKVSVGTIVQGMVLVVVRFIDWRNFSNIRILSCCWAKMSILHCWISIYFEENYLIILMASNSVLIINIY